MGEKIPRELEMNSYELMLSLLAHDSYNRGYDPDLPDMSVGN